MHPWLLISRDILTRCYAIRSFSLLQIGCDRSQNLVDICRDRHFQAVVGDALAVPLRSGSCDACISIAVIHHFSTAVSIPFSLQGLVAQVAGNVHDVTAVDPIVAFPFFPFSSLVVLQFAPFTEKACGAERRCVALVLTGGQWTLLLVLVVLLLARPESSSSLTGFLECRVSAFQLSETGELAWAAGTLRSASERLLSRFLVCPSQPLLASLMFANPFLPILLFFFFKTQVFSSCHSCF